MKQTKTVQVHPLIHKDGVILKPHSPHRMNWRLNNIDFSDRYDAVHLYFTDDSIPKKGELVLGDKGEIVKAWEAHIVEIRAKNPYWRKIVATTNPKLDLPQIPTQFIKDFVKAEGKITEVEIECEEKLEYNPHKMRRNPSGHYANKLLRESLFGTPIKTNSNNEVIVVKEEWTNSQWFRKPYSITGEEVSDDLEVLSPPTEEAEKVYTEQQMDDAIRVATKIAYEEGLTNGRKELEDLL